MISSTSTIKSILVSALFVAIIMGIISCQHVMLTPRSRKNVQREKPSVVLLDRIIEYRMEYNSWPFSKEEFTSKAYKYRDAFAGFRYEQVQFKIIDNNTMNFYFFGHVKDRENYQRTQKIELNSYAGRVRFYRENDKFIWKLKMN